jgi:hypothetical protein
MLHESGMYALSAVRGRTPHSRLSPGFPQPQALFCARVFGERTGYVRLEVDDLSDTVNLTVVHRSAHLGWNDDRSDEEATQKPALLNRTQL